MRVLITGGTGLIGRALIQGLAQAGHESVILTRHPDRAPTYLTATSWIAWDARSLDDWAEAVSEVDAVVNLAGDNIGSGLWTPKKKRRIQQSRETVGQLLTEAISRAGKRPAVLVQSSAVGYYGPHGNEPLDESSPPGEDWLAQVAVRWESSTAQVEDLGVRRAIIRTGLVFAERGSLLSRFMMPFRFFVGGRIGTGQQVVSWIHISDAVSAIRFLIENPAAQGAFNLTAPNAVTNAELSHMLGIAMRRPTWFTVPAPILRIVLGQMSQLVLSGQRALPQHLESLGFIYRFAYLPEALSDILKPR